MTLSLSPSNQHSLPLRRHGGKGPLARLLSILLTLLFLPALSASTQPSAPPDLTTPHFTFHFPQDLAGKAQETARAAEAAWADISGQLGMNPAGPIPVYLYAQHRDFRRAADIPARELVVGTSETHGGLIRLDLSGTFENPLRILRHETTHSILARGLGPRVHDLPLWFNEGLAQVAGQPVDVDSEEAARQARGEGNFLPLTDLSAEFPRGESAGVAYAEACSAVAYMVKLYGWDGVRRLLVGVRAGHGFAASFRAAAGMGIADFYDSWESSLVRRGWLSWLRMFYAPAVTFAMLWAAWNAYGMVRHRRLMLAEDEPDDPVDDSDAGIPDGDSSEARMDIHSDLRPG